MRRALLVLAALLLVGGCSFGQPEDTTTATTVAPERVVFVAIGSTETVEPNLAGDGWAATLFREHLPSQTVFVNLARTGNTVADALTEQLQTARDLEPTVAAVWFGAEDRAAGTDVGQYRADLESLAAALQESGATVLLAVDADDAYGAAARAVAEATGATVVQVTGAEGAPAIAGAFAARLPT